jgi:hypothetical protein
MRIANIRLSIDSPAADFTSPANLSRCSETRALATAVRAAVLSRARVFFQAASGSAGERCRAAFPGLARRAPRLRFDFFIGPHFVKLFSNHIKAPGDP